MSDYSKLAGFLKELTPAVKLIDGSKDVTAAGTAEQIAADTEIKWAALMAKSANTGNIYVGGETIDSTRGIPLAAGEPIVLPVTQLGSIWIDADTSSEGVTFIAGI